MKRIAVIGELNLDLILSATSGMPELGKEKKLSDMALVLGSSSAITSAQLTRLGNEVVFMSVVGADDYGRYALDSLRNLSVPTSHITVDPALRTGLTINIVWQGDRAQLTYLGCISHMSYDRIDFDAIAKCHHLHIGSFFLQEQLRGDCARIFARAKEMGLTTSLDSGWDDTSTWPDLEATLAYTDVFLPNEIEALSITHCATPDDALAALTKRVPLVVIKLGAKGALASRGQESCFCPGFIVDAFDTTGAGDSFDAGFLHAWLHGEALCDALTLGNATGALSTRAAGGTGSQATLEEALSWIKTAPRRTPEK
jgi:sugar/nucleoside kinase (ribokinase family)